MFKKIVIANRGEIALRIHRAANELGIKTVALYSEVDKNLLHLKMVDEAICIGKAPPKDSYLNKQAIITAALRTKADAIHPGSSFLAENGDFAALVAKNNITFIGSNPELIKVMNDKIAAINLMRKLGVACLPGSNNALSDDLEENLRLAKEIGYPVLIKSAGGGGGVAIHIVHTSSNLKRAIELTRAEAAENFDNPTVYMEKFLHNPRHIEIQILADSFGNVLHLGERDCSTQRWNKKFIEESPSPEITDAIREEIGAKCIRICKELNFYGLGTFEFLYEDGVFYFTGMNTRLQLGHTVTEQVTGLDLVKEQIKIAAGEKLTLQQSDIKLRGHAIECRIYAEDPRNFKKSSGPISLFHAPGGPGIRVDSHLYSGYVMPPNYDALIAKLISFGDTRKSAIKRMDEALAEIVVDGVVTNIPLHQLLMSDANFLEGKISNNYLEKKLGPL